MNNKIIKKNNGFTLIETMVAVIILTFSIAVFMNAISNSYFYSRYARNEITANYLLQEVVDFIKNDRDTKIVLGSETTWDTFASGYTDSCGDSSLGCTINTYNRDLTADICDTGTCGPLYYDEGTTTNFYNYDSVNGVETSFVRKIVVVKNTDNLDNQLDVTVTVSWRNGNQLKSKELKTYIMNW